MMKMKTSQVLIFGLIISFNVFSQTGKIIDAETSRPIPFVNIYSVSTSRGTITNDVGEFEWNGSPSDSVVITHLSYEPQKLLASQLGQVIKLKPHVALLSEVIVSNFAYNLMSKVYNRALERKDLKNYGKAFYRQITRNDDRVTEIHEVFYTLESNNGGVLRNSIDEARYAVKKSNDSTNRIVHMANASAVMLGASLVTNKTVKERAILNPFMSDANKYYSMSVSEKYDLDGEKYVKINFEPNDDVTKLASFGEVVLNQSTLEIRSISLSIKNSLGMDTIRNAKKKWATFNPLHKLTLDFLKNGQLNYMKYNTSFEYSDNVKKHKVEVEAFLFVFEQLDKTKNKLHASELKSNDLGLIRKKEYNAKFWRDNPIVKRTPLQEEIINQFEKDDAFGTMFSKK